MTPKRLQFDRFDTPLETFIPTSPQPFASPTSQPEEYTFPEGKGDHLAIYRDLIDAVQNGGKVVADGASAAQSLELANAITYSSHHDGVIEFPLDRDEYNSLLTGLQQHS